MPLQVQLQYCTIKSEALRQTGAKTAGLFANRKLAVCMAKKISKTENPCNLRSNKITVNKSRQIKITLLFTAIKKVM